MKSVADILILSFNKAAFVVVSWHETWYKPKKGILKSKERQQRALKMQPSNLHLKTAIFKTCKSPSHASKHFGQLCFARIIFLSTISFSSSVKTVKVFGAAQFFFHHSIIYTRHMLYNKLSPEHILHIYLKLNINLLLIENRSWNGESLNESCMNTHSVQDLCLEHREKTSPGIKHEWFQACWERGELVHFSLLWLKWVLQKQTKG